MAPFETEVKLRFYHMDRAGMVFHGAYTTFFQDAFEELMEHVGYIEKELETSLGLRVPVVQHEMAFPAHPTGDRLVLQVAIPEVGTTSFTLSMAALDPAGTVVATARVVRVCIDGQGQATRVPGSLREAWAPHRAPLAACAPGTEETD